MYQYNSKLIFITLKQMAYDSPYKFPARSQMRNQAGLPHSSRNVLGAATGSGFFSWIKRNVSKAVSTVKNFAANNHKNIRKVIDNAPDILKKSSDILSGIASAVATTSKNENIGKVANALKSVSTTAGDWSEKSKKFKDNKLQKAVTNQATNWANGKEVKIDKIVEAAKDTFAKKTENPPPLQTVPVSVGGDGETTPAQAKKSGGSVRRTRGKGAANDLKALMSKIASYK